MNHINLPKIKCIGIAIALSCGLCVSSGHATTTPIRALEQAVTNRVEAELKRQHISGQLNQRISFRVHSIDPRLQLTQCSNPLQVDLPGAKLIGRISARVSCQGQKPWSIYVPVSILAYKKVVTARAPLARGTLLKTTHLQLTEVEISGLNQGYLSAVRLATGKQLKRAVRLNDILKPNMLVEPKVISRGDDITILVSSGPLEVRSSGVALTDGKRGQQISVKNKASKRIIRATVVSKTLVKAIL